MRRTLLLSLVLVGALAGTGALYLADLGRSDSTTNPKPHEMVHRTLASLSPSPSTTLTSTPKASPLPPLGSEVLTYLRGTQVMSRQAGSTAEQLVVNLKTADVSASPASEWVAFVRSKGSGSEESDFVRRPNLHLLDLDSGIDVNLGVGLAPMWNPLDTRLVYLRPDQPRNCDGEICSGRLTVMLATPEGSPRPISGAGHWHLLAWAGDRVLASEESDPSRIESISTDGDLFSIALPPNQFWDAAPDGKLLLRAVPGQVSFTRLLAGRVQGRASSFAIPGATLGDGAWSAESGRIAAVLRDSDGIDRAVLLSEGEPPAVIPRSEGAMGNFVWDVAGDHFAYVAVSADNPNHLEAVICRALTGAPVTCRSLFTWSQGVSLLRLNDPQG